MIREYGGTVLSDYNKNFNNANNKKNDSEPESIKSKTDGERSNHSRLRGFRRTKLIKFVLRQRKKIKRLLKKREIYRQKDVKLKEENILNEVNNIIAYENLCKQKKGRTRKYRKKIEIMPDNSDNTKSEAQEIIELTEINNLDK